LVVCKLALKETLSLAYRLEYFDAKDATAGLGLLAGTSVVGNTLSLNYKVGNLTIIRIRLDTASEDIFTNSAAASKVLQRMLYWQQPILLISTIFF
jgi:hypothetical protein